MLLVGGLVLVVVIVVIAATRGGENGGNSSAQTLNGSVSRSKAEVSGNEVVASTRVRVDGIAGTRVTLKWGLVDSLSGRASVQDRVARRFTTTADTTTHDVVIRFRKPLIPSHYIINFALFGPDGLLDSGDTGEFIVPE
jgi:hypothetical protein